MLARKILFLVAAVMLSAGVVCAKPPPTRVKRQLEKEIPDRVPVSAEARRLAAEYRRNPSDEARDALRRQVRKDYTEFVNKLRSKIKPDPRPHHRHYQRKAVERMTHNRDRIVDEIVRRLISGDASEVAIDTGSDDEPEKPAPKHKDTKKKKK